MVLFFFFPLRLVPADSELVAVYAFREDGTAWTYEPRDSSEFLSELQNMKCHRILDTTYNYSGDRVKYEIVLNTPKGSFHILIGDPDPVGTTTMMNKAYRPTQEIIKYKIINHSQLRSYLDHLTGNAEGSDGFAQP